MGDAAGLRIGVFSVHGITRHAPLRMAIDVTVGIHGWLQQRTGRAWSIRLREPVVGRRRPRRPSQYVIESDDPDAPAICVSESNWSDLTRDRFRRYTIRQWVQNTIATAGEATRAINRKTELELLFVMTPLVALVVGMFAVMGFVVDTAQRAGPEVIPFLFFAALLLCSLHAPLVTAFAPLVRRRLRILREGMTRYAEFPAGARHAAAMFDATNAPPSDPNNIILVLLSALRGSFGSVGWFIALVLYTRFALGAAGLAHLRRVSLGDALAFAALAVAVLFGLRIVRRLSAVYEPLEDIYSYADPSREARLNRNDVVRRVAADLQTFLATSTFDAVVLTGHSLGSVLVLDALAETVRDIEAERYDARHLAPICAVIMYGSPFAKINTQIRALDPRRFDEELTRSAIALQLLSDVAEENQRAVCHNIYYLTDVVAEKIVMEDDSIANYLLPSPLRLWSHGAYHGDRAFWSVVFEAAQLGDAFAEYAPEPRPQGDAERFAVPPRWPEPSWRRLVLAFAVLGTFVVASLFLNAALARGANPTVALVFLLVLMTTVTLTIRD